jgi:hypothetical protein
MLAHDHSPDDIVFDMFVISILNSNLKSQFKNPFKTIKNALIPERL